MHTRLTTLLGASALIVLPALAACGGATADAEAAPATPAAGEARFAESLEDEPCSLVTKETVAAVFEIPAAEIEQTQTLSFCTCGWEGDGRTLDVTVNVGSVSEDAARAASHFASATGGMSGAAFDRAMGDINRRAAASGELDTAGERAAAGAVTASAGSDRGIQFEDVEGVGDQARLALTVGAGDLWVRVGNLVFTVSAYSGPEMPMPDELNAGAVTRASKEWRRETMPQRKEAAVKVARAAVASL